MDVSKYICGMISSQNRVRIGAVSYLNTKPMIHGFDEPAFREVAEVIFDYPARVAADLKSGKVDVGLIPVAAIPEVQNAQIISKYCIGAVGRVASVAIFSEVPIEEVEILLLDYQSRTSVRLAEVLLKEYWKKEVKLCPAGTDYVNEIKGTTAGVIIGDRALQLLDKFPFVYDLAEHWQIYTGLPFVFAAWVANRPLSEDFIQKFEEANAVGFRELDRVVEEHFATYYDLKKYYQEDISYHLDEDKKRGLSLFFEKIHPNYQLNFLHEVTNQTAR